MMLSNKELWCILTGRSSVLAQSEIKRVLSENITSLTNCLSTYKTPNSSSLKKLESDASVKKKDFAIRLSKLLHLDEWQTHILIQNFVRTEFRGSTDQLQKIFHHDAQTEGLIYKILDYFFMERMHLLWCIKYILSYWQDPTCYFNTEFAVAVDELVNRGFIDNAIRQFKDLTSNGFVHNGIKGNIPLQMYFATQGLKTQCELLEIILLYYKDFEISGERFVEISNIFEARGFGAKQPDKRLLDHSGDAFIEKIGFLSNLILLEAVDLEFFSNSQRLGSSVYNDHHLAANQSTIQKLDETFWKWTDAESRSPILLAWALLRFHIKDGEGMKVCQILGQSATQSGVLGYILSVLKWSTNCSVPMKNLIKSLLYTLVSQALMVFDESSFGYSQQHIFSVANNLLDLPGLCDEMSSKQTPVTGLKLVLDSAKFNFPHLMCPFLDMLTVLCTDEDSTNFVFEYVNNMKSMTELFRFNRADEIEAIDDEGGWKRSIDRVCISSETGHDQIILPRGTVGKLIDPQNVESRLVCWKFDYSGWKYLTLELEQLILNPGECSPYLQEDLETRLISIIKLLKAVIEHDWSKAEFLEPMISRLFTAIARYGPISSPPLDLVAACLQALSIAAKHAPIQVLNHLNQVGFLPSTTDDQIIGDNFSAMHLVPGTYGQLLSSSECASGRYPVTKAYLDLIAQLHNLTTDASSTLLSEDAVASLLACISFMVKHIFASFYTWKYATNKDREEIGENILEIFHSILATNYTDVQDANVMKYATFARGIISEGMLYNEAGESLLRILGTGVDSVNASVIDSVSNGEKKASLVQLVKLALAVLDRLLQTKKSEVVTPMENAIFSKYVTQASDLDFSQSTERYPLMIIIAKYIHHDYDAKLPTLAVIVLQRLCVASPISLLASFGRSAAALKNAFVTRLEIGIESIRLKIAILNFLTSAVECQPGLIELFIHQEEETSKLNFLHVVLDFLNKNDCQMALRRGALQFLHSLWSSRTDSALMTIRKRGSSWSDMTSLLFRSNNDKLSFEEMGCWALIIKIITLETYYISNNDFDDGFISCLKTMSGKFYKKVGEILCQSEDLKSSGIFKRNKMNLLYLVIAWREYLLVASTLHPEKCMLNTASVKEDILTGQIKVFQKWVNEDDCEIIEEVANTIMVLSAKWACSLSQVSKILSDLISLLQDVFNGREAVFAASKVQLFSSMLSILENSVSSKEVDESLLLKLLPFIGHGIRDMKQISIHGNQEELDSRSFNVSLVILNLLSCLVKHLSFKAPLCSMIRECTAIPVILQTVNYCIQTNSCLNFAKSALSMLLAFAGDEQMSEMMANSGTAQALTVNFNISNHRLDDAIFAELWCHFLAITTAVLKSTGNSFVNQAIDFVGAYRERLLQSSLITGRVHSLSLLKESELTSKLLFALSPYWMRWNSMQPELVHRLQSGTMLMLQTSVAFLSRPRLLSHVATAQDKLCIESLLERARTPSPSFSRDSSTIIRDDATESLSGAAGETQERLINIVVNCTGALRNLTPNIVEAILDEGMDLDGFNPLVELVFNSPSLDETPAFSFGILISCMNTCLRTLQQITPNESPRSSPLKQNSATDGDRCQSLRTALNYIIENAIIIIISQASCYLRCTGIDPRTKQFLKRELGSELTNFLYSFHRYLSRRSIPQTPRNSDKQSPQTYKRSPSKLGPVFADDEDGSIYKLADIYAKQLLL